MPEAAFDNIISHSDFVSCWRKRHILRNSTYDTILSPIIDDTSVKMKNKRQKVAGSWKKRIPTKTVPTAPIPANQIDKPFLDERTNGLSYAAKYMMDSELCWQITLSADECERSALAIKRF